MSAMAGLLQSTSSWGFPWASTCSPSDGLPGTQRQLRIRFRLNRTHPRRINPIKLQRSPEGLAHPFRWFGSPTPRGQVYQCHDPGLGAQRERRVVANSFAHGCYRMTAVKRPGMLAPVPPAGVNVMTSPSFTKAFAAIAPNSTNPVLLVPATMLNVPTVPAAVETVTVIGPTVVTPAATPEARSIMPAFMTTPTAATGVAAHEAVKALTLSQSFRGRLTVRGIRRASLVRKICCSQCKRRRRQQQIYLYVGLYANGQHRTKMSILFGINGNSGGRCIRQRAVFSQQRAIDNGHHFVKHGLGRALVRLGNTLLNHLH
jgi:hypothetical protein